ncbi:Endo-1,4-beta-xylanase A precursor [Paenibacillus konkukensis]|uniref:Endo-1,4-beta-xylanase A n=1 Tax=Paenibacillus konkukensis TaxID=2020716 RepID=A0ABY4RI32_9BACL|nr:CehA/McbA family metallohydrolase [Paenibacillus konkukensis]UQZ81097.1 Endo-1,4-beta-xylanase A precursor [Paenibacillus konkukensis]
MSIARNIRATLVVVWAAAIIFATAVIFTFSPATVYGQIGNGLKGEYFDNADFTDLKITRTDANVNFNWGAGAPDPSMGADSFSVRWTGQIRPQYSQKYQFYAGFDGGVRLWVNGELLLDQWSDQTAAEWTSFITLTAGTDYDIRLDYYSNTGNASVKLYWSSASQAKQIVPQSRLSETPPLISAGKTATAQTFEAGHGPEYGNDADATNSSYWSAYPYPQWWQLDLGASYDIKTVRIRNYVDGTRYYRYTVQTSADGTSWTTVAAKTNNDAAADAGDTYAVSGTGRYIRVNVTYDSANRGTHISDVKVYGYKACTLDPILLTTGKTAEVEALPSSPGDPITTYTQTGHEPQYAIDGDASNSSYASISPYQHYWQVDLQDNYKIKQLNIRNYADGTRYYQYRIYVSKDQFNWTEVAAKTDEKAAVNQGDSYAVDAVGRYIRVMGTYNSANAVFHISDFKAYGYRENVPVPEPVANRSAFSIIQSSDNDAASGITFIPSPDSTHEYGIGSDSDASSATVAGRYLRFDNVDFGSTGANQFIARVYTPNADAGQPQETVRLEVRLDSPTGTLAGTLPAFKQWTRNSTLACDMANVTGVHNVYLVIGNNSAKGLGINWFQFARKTALPSPAPRPAPLPAPVAYNVYFGNLHSHTAFSDGKSVPDTAFNYARNTAHLDFLAVTDHSNLYDHDLAWDQSLEWRDLKASADRNTVNGSFVAIAGSETTWYPPGGFGHMNTFAMEHFNTYETEYNDANRFYAAAKQYPASIVQWNHPWDADFNGFTPYDADVDNVMDLIETAQSGHPSIDNLSHYTTALDLGWHVAPSGNQDNHAANWGTLDTRRTAILAEKLTREDIYDAIRSHRVYATTDANMKVMFKINNQMMGSTLSNPSALNFTIGAADPDAGDTIKKIEVYTEGGQLAGSANFNSNNVSWTSFSVTNNTKKYYFIKVTQADGQAAVTAPIWTGL